MTASTVKSEEVTGIESDPRVIMEKKKGRLVVQLDQDAIAITSVDEAGDVMLFCPIPSNCIIKDVEILNDELDAHACPTLAVDVGLYYSGIGGNQKQAGNVSGTVIDADAFASASTILDGANVSYASLRFEADDIVDVKKEAWEVGGLSADPGGIFYVGLTVTTAAATDAAGDVVMVVSYLI